MKKPNPKPRTKLFGEHNRRFLFSSVAILMALQSNQAQNPNPTEPKPPCELIHEHKLPYRFHIELEEVAPKQFAVVKEIIMKFDSSDVNDGWAKNSKNWMEIRYRNGKRVEYNWEQIQKMVQPQDLKAGCDTALHMRCGEAYNSKKKRFITQCAAESNYNTSVHSISYVLMGSVVGYYFGKSLLLPPNPNVYLDAKTQYRYNQHIDSYLLDEKELVFKYQAPLTGNTAYLNNWHRPLPLPMEQKIKLENFKTRGISHPEKEKKISPSNSDSPQNEQEADEYDSPHTNHSSHGSPSDGKSGFLGKESKDTDPKKHKSSDHRPHQSDLLDKDTHKSHHSSSHQEHRADIHRRRSHSG